MTHFTKWKKFHFYLSAQENLLLERRPCVRIILFWQFSISLNEYSEKVNKNGILH